MTHNNAHIVPPNITPRHINLAGDVTQTTSNSKVVALRGNSVSSSTPSSGQVLSWNGSNWAPGTATAGTASNIFPFTIVNGGSYTMTSSDHIIIASANTTVSLVSGVSIGREIEFGVTASGITLIVHSPTGYNWANQYPFGVTLSGAEVSSIRVICFDGNNWSVNHGG